MADPLTYANSDEYVLVNPSDPKVGHLIYDAPMVDAETKQFIRDPETGKIKVYRMVIWGTKGLTQAQVEALITEKNASMVTKVNTLETRVTNFLDADDSTLDQLSELITEIKANRANIALIVSNKATKEELQEAINTINTNIANSYVALANNQTITGNKTFTGEVNVPTMNSTDNSTKAASTAFVQEALGALTGTSVENLVTKNAEQTITGLKTFNTLPQSSETPTDDKDLVNKKYVDDAVPTNMMTTDTTQIVSGVKTFTNTIIGSITGNAATATKATQDSDGNTIKTTYAKLNSPALTGTPTAPTASTNTNNTQIATTAYVKAQGYLTSHQSLDSCVKTSGNQTITGNKTFNNITITNSINLNGYTLTIE